MLNNEGKVQQRIKRSITNRGGRVVEAVALPNLARAKKVRLPTLAQPHALPCA